MIANSVWEPDVQADIERRTKYIRKDGRKIARDGFLQDVEGVYHAIGGFARLVHIADDDPKWFFEKFGHRLLPNEKKEIDHNITIQPALPKSPLDEKVDPNAIGLQRPQVAEHPLDELGRRVGSQRSLPSPALDQGSDQAPWCAPPGVGCTPGSEDTAIEDGEGEAFA